MKLVPKFLVLMQIVAFALYAQPIPHVAAGEAGPAANVHSHAMDHSMHPGSAITLASVQVPAAADIPGGGLEVPDEHPCCSSIAGGMCVTMISSPPGMTGPKRSVLSPLTWINALQGAELSTITHPPKGFG